MTKNRAVTKNVKQNVDEQNSASISDSADLTEFNAEAETLKPSKAKSRPKPPSWLKPAESVDNAGTQNSENEMSSSEISAQPQNTGHNEAIENSSAPSVSSNQTVSSETAPAGSSVLLGAPVMADDGLDILLAPTILPMEESKSEAHPLACVVGGFAAPLNLEDKTLNANTADASGAAVRQSAAPNHEKLQSELEQLNNIVDSVESLEYLKPRLKKISLVGCESSDLVGLYRMVSQVLLDNLRTQINSARQMREQYEKRLRQVVVDKSAEFVQMVSSGQIPVRAEASSESASEGGSTFMLRKQLEIKEELLLKAREAQADAEARYEKAAQDVVNIRQRQDKDVALHLQKSREALLYKILPALDSFDSALASSNTFVDIESVIEGLSNIHKQLLDACMSEGLQPIEAKGQPFDPELHEAMGYVATDEVPEDYVVTDLRRGYLLNDKLLRAAMVQVARSSK